MQYCFSTLYQALKSCNRLKFTDEVFFMKRDQGDTSCGGGIGCGPIKRASWLFWPAMLGLALLLCWLLNQVLLPFVAGFAVAYMLDPVCRALTRLGVPRALAALVVLAVFVVLVAWALYAVVPLLVTQASGLAQQAPDVVLALRDKAQVYLENFMTTLTDEDKLKLRQTLEGYSGQAFELLKLLAAKVWQSGSAVFGAVSFLLVMPVVAFYLMKDWPAITTTIKNLLPRRQAPIILEQMHQIDRTLASFLRGQLTVCVILATYYAVALTLAGLNYGAMIGITAGVFSFIPFVGAGFGLVASLGVAFIQFPDLWSVAIILGIFVFAQLVESNIITPKLVGESIGLHPVWIIFALMAGGALLGFTGLFLAVPMAAVLGVLVRFAVGRYLQSRWYDPKQAEGSGRSRLRRGQKGIKILPL
jgi:predicted PurR-regulated permease PerM